MLPGSQSDALIEGVLDVGFTRPLETPFDQLLRSEVLYQDPLVAVFPKGHPLARGRLNLKSLARERFVLVARESAPTLFGKILALCSRAGFSPQIVATGIVWASVALLVEAGEGIAILPSNLRDGASKNLAFCPLTNHDAAIGLVMAWSPRREGPVLKAFLKLVRDYRNSQSRAADPARRDVRTNDR
jgi:DNA-binding transcriptional LysR family regulator